MIDRLARVLGVKVRPEISRRTPARHLRTADPGRAAVGPRELPVGRTAHDRSRPGTIVGQTRPTLRRARWDWPAAGTVRSAISRLRTPPRAASAGRHRRSLRSAPPSRRGAQDRRPLAGDAGDRPRRYPATARTCRPAPVRCSAPAPGQAAGAGRRSFRRRWRRSMP
ncbi:MAG: hypothetical protein MZW92_00585 [Comamonadaceae bacterium]|nr:hypothetical protein [Comamonadaceae bacterium]